MSNFKPQWFSDDSIIEQNIVPIINKEGNEDFGVSLTVTTGYACVEVVLDYNELRNIMKYFDDVAFDQYEEDVYE